MVKRRPGFLRPTEEVQNGPGTEIEAHPSIDQPTDRPIVNQCLAHRKNGARCRKPSIRGATVCLAHGGGAPQVRRKAQVRLAMAADDLMKQLITIALSEEDPAIRLRAVMGALDRAGIGPKAELEVTHELKPYEQILQDLPTYATISRGPSPDAPAVDPADAEAAARYSSTESGGHSHDIVDAEVVEDPPERRPTDARPTRPGGPMETFSWDEVYGDDSPRPRRRGTSFRRG